jgi:hypothetical protein
MIEVPNNVIELANHLRVILADELGKVSRGSPAIWIEGEPIPTAWSCDGVQIVLSDEPLTRKRDLTTGSQVHMTQMWQGVLTQFGDDPEYVQARIRARDKMQASFARFDYRPAAPDSRAFRRAMLKFEFDTIVNPMICS